MKKLLPIILILIGTGAGVGAGVFLRPPPPEPTEEQIEEHEAALEAEAEEQKALEYEYVKMNNQFIIPLVEQGEVNSLVVMSLSVEVQAGNKEVILLREPKLRDSFLQVMFDHANIGGFRGDFTSAENLEVLRTGLREIAVRDGGDIVTDVLILEIARQDY